jgi:hypothetical protein
MARPRKDGSSAPKLSGGQASYVLERLIKDRRVSQSDVNGYLSQMSNEISELEARLQHLKDAVGGAASAAVASIASAVAAVRRKPGRPPGKRGPGRPPGSGRKPGRPPAAASAAPAAPEGGVKRRRRRTAITSEQLASRQLQGRYLALVRRFTPTKRAQFAKVAKERGREAAIKEMQDSIGKK